MDRKILIRALAVFSGLTFILVSNAQTLKKEVYVVSSFRPEVTDADKLGFMPSLGDTFRFAAPVSYSVLPSTLKTEFTLKPIKPAKMVGTPLDQLYNSQLKMGIGNYLTPLIEYNIQNLRSKEYAVGGYVMHKSSHYKMDIDPVKDIPAGYGKNEIMGYGKRFYDGINLFAKAGASMYKIRNYGLYTSNLSEDFNVSIKDIQQIYYNGYATAGLHSTFPDSGKVNFSLSLSGNIFRDFFEKSEPHVNVAGALQHRIGTFQAGVKGEYDYYKLQSPTDSLSQSFLTFNPFFRKVKEEWQLQIGAFVTVYNSPVSDTVYIYPDASMKIRIIEKVMSGFVGITGGLEQNPYQKLASENPFILPGEVAPNTHHKFKIYGGLEGYFSSKASYKFIMAFESVEDMVFYRNSLKLQRILNDSSHNPLKNYFEADVYDADIVSYHGEVTYHPFQFLSFLIRGTYNDFRLYGTEKPWHRPATELYFDANYNFKKKIYAGVGLMIWGKRYAQDFRPNPQTPQNPVSPYNLITLKPVYDLNLNLEYRFSNVLSFFLNFYNLANQDYYLWNQYPAQQINVLGGFVYKF